MKLNRIIDKINAHIDITNSIKFHLELGTYRHYKFIMYLLSSLIPQLPGDLPTPSELLARNVIKLGFVQKKVVS